MSTTLQRRLKKLEAANPADMIVDGMSDEELFDVLRGNSPGTETEEFIRCYQAGESLPALRGRRDQWGVLSSLSDAQLTRIARGRR
ncbi:hypothetical protein [Enterovirga sp. CN4-39]|uniref:hypothetical protein n=1 Tax=Enterovirga sp. CN4-39 TaxID=3400910 RepID=UPI003C0DCEBD